MKQKINVAITIVVLGCATAVRADLAEFNAINSAARAARERGDNAALLANIEEAGRNCAGSSRDRNSFGAGERGTHTQVTKDHNGKSKTL